MLGAVVLVFVMVVVFPPLLFGTGLIVSALISWLGTIDAKDRYADTEWVNLQ